MQTMNHTAVYFLKALRVFEKEESKRHLVVQNATEYLEKNVALLLLPDAIRMYGPRQQFHFTEHPITKKVSSVTFSTIPNNLIGIKNCFQANLQPDIPKSVIDERSHPEEFEKLNPAWKKTAYITHLYQDYYWDKEIRNLVDVSGKFDDSFIYFSNQRIVDGATFRKELVQLDDVFFNEIAKMIYSEFDVFLNEKWFEDHVYSSLLREYDKELADNTWKYIKLPREENPTLDFVTESEIKDAVERMTELTIMFCS